MNGHTDGPCAFIGGHTTGVLGKLLAAHARKGGFDHLNPVERLEVLTAINALEHAGKAAGQFTPDVSTEKIRAAIDMRERSCRNLGPHRPPDTPNDRKARGHFDKGRWVFEAEAVAAEKARRERKEEP